MATHKSAAKRAKQTIVKTERNKAQHSEVKTAVKKVREAINNKQKDVALKLLPEAQGLLRKLAKTGIIKKQTAARQTGRLARQVAKL